MTSIFGENLRKFRNNITQARFADKINKALAAHKKEASYTNRSVSKWENGDAMPSLDVVLVLSEMMGVSLDDLFKKEVQEFNPIKSVEKQDLPFIVDLTEEGGGIYVDIRYYYLREAINNIYKKSYDKYGNMHADSIILEITDFGEAGVMPKFLGYEEYKTGFIKDGRFRVETNDVLHIEGFCDSQKEFDCKCLMLCTDEKDTKIIPINGLLGLENISVWAKRELSQIRAPKSHLFQIDDYITLEDSWKIEQEEINDGIELLKSAIDIDKCVTVMPKFSGANSEDFLGNEELKNRLMHYPNAVKNNIAFIQSVNEFSHCKTKYFTHKTRIVEKEGERYESIVYALHNVQFHMSMQKYEEMCDLYMKEDWYNRPKKSWEFEGRRQNKRRN